jgi:hypothetical protein
MTTKYPLNDVTDSRAAGVSPAAGERIRKWGAVLWPSFLIAGVATMIFFGNVDPEDLRSATFPQIQIDRKLGYTLGFFMFGGVTAWSSFLTMTLLRTDVANRGDT